MIANRIHAEMVEHVTILSTAPAVPVRRELLACTAKLTSMIVYRVHATTMEHVSIESAAMTASVRLDLSVHGAKVISTNAYRIHAHIKAQRTAFNW